MKKLKLPIELIPVPCLGKNLRTTLTAWQWRKLRANCFKLANYVCDVCGGVGEKEIHRLECHELWVYNDKTQKQTLSRLQALCPKCHNVKHLDITRCCLRDEKVNTAFFHLDRFMTVNKIKSREKAMQIIDSAFYEWKVRSTKQWVCDISIIKQFELSLPSGFVFVFNQKEHNLVSEIVKKHVELKKVIQQTNKSRKQLIKAQKKAIKIYKSLGMTNEEINKRIIN